MTRAQAILLADGRMHLHHGPIDLILAAEGPARAAAMARAAARFETVLQELAGELALLRQPVPGPAPVGVIARRMWQAATAHRARFVTPMAAVAGAVGDDILTHMRSAGPLRRASVNNGGDIALYLAEGEMTGAIAGVPTRLIIRAQDGVRGVATSGWRGRSLSLGIADSVTVLARTAAQADVAATLIANAVDLPGHPAITRRAAHDIQCDNDLGARLVTTNVGALSRQEVRQALDRGTEFGKTCHKRGLITAAFLCLQGQTQSLGTHPGMILQSEPVDA